MTMTRVHGTAAPLRVDTLVDRYFHEIESSVGLSSADEVRLARRIKRGDETAVTELVTANLRFVVSVAKQYQNLGLPLSDLINEGNFGLVIAARRFDGNRGFKFISYAVWWIRQAILQALAEQSRVVRLPLNRVNELTRVSRIINKLEQRFGHPATIEELAAELEAEPQEMEFLAGLAQRPISMEAPVDPAEPERTFGDTLEDESVISGEDILADDDLKEQIRRALGTLTDREARILRMYYGLDGHDSMTLEEIGLYIGRTRERVRQIKEMALQKLRHPQRRELLAEAR